MWKHEIKQVATAFQIQKVETLNVLTLLDAPRFPQKGR